MIPHNCKKINICHNNAIIVLSHYTIYTIMFITNIKLNFS